MDSGDYDSETQTRLLDSIITPCYIIAISSVAARIYSRRTLGPGGLWWDDWLAVISTAPATAAFLLYMLNLRNTLGHHIYAIGVDAYTPFLKSFFVIELLYLLILGCAKASLILMYWRLFAVSARAPIIFVAVLLGVWTITSILVAVFQCSPISFFWDKFGEQGQCWDIQTLFLGISIPNIVTDFMLAALPFRYIIRLNLRLPQRLLLGGIFAVGGLVVTASIVRLILFMQQDLNDPDITYDLTMITILSIVEIMAGITCACMPTLRPVLKFFHRLCIRHIPWFTSQGSTQDSSDSGQTLTPGLAKKWMMPKKNGPILASDPCETASPGADEDGNERDVFNRPFATAFRNNYRLSSSLSRPAVNEPDLEQSIRLTLHEGELAKVGNNSNDDVLARMKSGSAAGDGEGAKTAPSTHVRELEKGEVDSMFGGRSAGVEHERGGEGERKAERQADCNLRNAVRPSQARHHFDNTDSPTLGGNVSPEPENENENEKDTPLRIDASEALPLSFPLPLRSTRPGTANDNATATAAAVGRSISPFSLSPTLPLPLPYPYPQPPPPPPPSSLSASPPPLSPLSPLSPATSPPPPQTMPSPLLPSPPQYPTRPSMRRSRVVSYSSRPLPPPPPSPHASPSPSSFSNSSRNSNVPAPAPLRRTRPWDR